MEEQTISLSGKNLIVIKAHGDLSLQGWDQLEARLLIDDIHNLRISQDGETLQVICLEDCDLMVPDGISVRIDKTGGDAHVRGIKGKLEIQKVGGNLSVEGVGDLEIGGVGGDCLVYQVSGQLSGSRFSGDCTGLEVGGPLAFEHIGGDAILQVVSGPVSLRTGGDINLQVTQLTAPVSLRAGGDIRLHLPMDASASLDLESGGDQISIHVADKDETVEKWAYGAKLGDGSFPVKVDAGGEVLVTDEVWDKSDVEDSVDDLENHWKDLEDERQGPHSRSRHWPDIEAITRRATRHGERAARKAEERVHSAMRRMGNFPPVPPIPPMPPIPPIPPVGPFGPRVKVEPSLPRVSSEERMLILQMLQEKKISVEEAEKLLQALEG
jgi:hypothetical protein